MGTTWGEQVVSTTSAVLDALEPLAARGWDERAGALEWTCAQTAIHVAHDLLKYAAQLAGQTEDSYLRFRVTAADDESPAELLRIIRGCGRVLGAVVDGSPADATAWHYGPTDASGFAAMGIGEMLVHTHDIALGLGHDWRPPSDLAECVTSRLHEGSPPTDDPATLLLWSTGRIDVPGLDRVDSWVWRTSR